MTDLYPDEEGYIEDGLQIGFAKAYESIALHAAIDLGTTGVSGYVSVGQAAFKAGVGIALRAADTNDIIPVLFYGIVKQYGEAGITPGELVVSGTTGTYVAPMPALAAATVADLSNNLCEWVGIGAGATTQYYRLGMALQPATTAGDEALILIGAIR